MDSEAGVEQAQQLVVVATTATIMAEHTERGDQLFTQMLNRHGRHALDLGALDLLD